MTTWKKIVKMLVLVALLVPTAALVAIQIPAVQTALVEKVTGAIGRSLNGSAHVGKVYFSMPNSLILKDINIIQGDSDTVLHASKLLVKVKTTSFILSDQARARRISLENGFARIRRLDDSTTTLSLLLAPFKKKEKKEKDDSPLPWESIHLDKLTVKNFDFYFNDRPPSEAQPATPSGHIDWKNLGITNINLIAKDIHYDKELSVTLGRFSFSEHNGLDMEYLGGQVKLGGDGLAIFELEYKDAWSEVHSDHFALGFKNFSELSDLFGKVSLEASVNNTRFDLRSLYYFSGIEGLKDSNLSVWLDGGVSGPFNKLKADLIRIRSHTKETVVTMKGRINGLPDIKQAYIEANIFDGSTNTSDLSGIISRLGLNLDAASISKFAKGETISFNGQLTGPMADLNADLEISTEGKGSATLNASIRNLMEGSRMQIDGKAAANRLELGSLLGIPTLGALTADAEIDLLSSKSSSEISVSPIHIHNFTFNGYNYHGIVANGQINGKKIAADLISNDPSLRMSLHGDIDLGDKGQDKRYLINMNLDTADLSALHFDKREGVTASMSLNADIVQTAKGDFLGQASIRDLEAKVQDESFDVGNIFFNSTLDNGSYGLSLTSSFIKADYYGNLFITDYISKAARLASNGRLNSLIDTSSGQDSLSDGHGSLTISTIDMSPICSFLAPELFVSQESSISVNMLGDYIEGEIGSELLASGKLFVRNTQGRIFTDDGLLRMDLDIDRIESGALAVEHLALDAAADSSAMDVRLSFANQNGSNNKAEINSRISFAGSEFQEDGWKIKADILPSKLTLANIDWSLAPATIGYREKHIAFDGFEISHGSQSLEINGIVGEHPHDTLRVRLDDFDVSIVNAFIKKDLNIHGQLTGQGRGIALLGKQKGLLLDLAGKEFAMAGRPLGDLRVQSRWNDSDKRFDFLVNNSLEGRYPVKATANYRPSDKNTGINLQLDRLNLGFLEPFLTKLVSGIDGSVSGRLTASGPIDRLELKSEHTRLNDLKFKLLYTQVDYTADGPFEIASDGVTFNDISIKDKYGHEAVLTGGVPYDHFNDLRLNARINLQNLLALNTKSSDNETFYGKAFADGTVRISGPLDAIRLNLNLTTRPNTIVHIPLGASAKESSSLLTFINNKKKRDLYDSLVLARNVYSEKKNSGGGTGLSVNLRLNTTPDAEIQIEIDRNTGDILKARGNGNIGIVVGGNTPFDIKGDYRVESGNYHFGMLGITSRDFSINSGGTIGFTGDVMQSKLDLTATYRTKASISPLIADSTAVSTRRTVECGIAITGRLSNPNIGFKINIPDLDPTTQGRVESALNTEDKRMKQALALLISGGFVPDEQSGIVNSTTMLYANASELMAGQVNNIFRQLDIPLDLGFNYQPSETGRDIFDVAVSTQLFNNRVSINGNIGNRQYMSSSNSDIVGDIDVEIKLNRQGQVRLTLFSHSADQYSNYLDQSQRNGAGIVYQEDFDSFRELWRKIFKIKDNEGETIPDSNTARRP